MIARLHGEIVAMFDRCPHRGAPLSAGSVQDDVLVCAYHGWRFDASGKCVEVPSLGRNGLVPPNARCRQPFGAIERYGLVFVAIEEPLMELPTPSFLGDSTRESVDLAPFTGPFGAGLLIDNQLDVGHFAFVHRQTFGCEQAEIPPSYKVDRRPWGFDYSLEIPIAARHDPEVAAGVRPITQHRTMHYRYRAPFFLELTLHYPAMEGSNRITFFVQPETVDRATMYVSLSFSQSGGLTAEQLRDRVAFEYKVIGEDLELQARFDCLELPLELSEQAHVRVDRASVEFRRILAALVNAPESAMAKSSITALQAVGGEQ